MANESSSARGFLMAQLTLRILVVGFTIAAIATTVSTRQTVVRYGEVEHLYYTRLPPLRFQLATNAVVCVLSFASMIFVYALSSPKSHPKNYYPLFFYDVLVTMVSISGCAAGTVEQYLAKSGQEESFWSPYCHRAENFCQKLLITVIFSYIAFLCLFMLTIMDAYKLRVSGVHNSNDC